MEKRENVESPPEPTVYAQAPPAAGEYGDNINYRNPYSFKYNVIDPETANNYEV